MLMEKTDILRAWHQKIPPYISRHLSTKSCIEDLISPLLHILSPPNFRPVIDLNLLNSLTFSGLNFFLSFVYLGKLSKFLKHANIMCLASHGLCLFLQQNMYSFFNVLAEPLFVDWRLVFH